MLIFRTVHEIQSWIRYQISIDKSIGFTPTMGALHAGHIALIEQSKKENDISVCSIFVNPTQFNDKQDLDKYPRTLKADSNLLTTAHCDILFYPSVDEIYPKTLKEINVDLHGLDQVMEGAHRPGHFKGVVQVVHRLLDIIQPTTLYMGQKDFQQFTIIGQMIRNLNLSVQLKVCPIYREPHGLAMSSRNERLSTKGRNTAGCIYKYLQQGLGKRNHMTPDQVCQYVIHLFKDEQTSFNVEYIEIVNETNLKSLTSWPEVPGEKAICIAVWLEGVRLIDNITFI